MAYKVLTYINLPYIELRKAPGDTVTKKELADANQTDEDIKALIDGGSLSEDMSAELHEDHRPVQVLSTGAAGATQIVSGDSGVGEGKAV